MTRTRPVFFSSASAVPAESRKARPVGLSSPLTQRWRVRLGSVRDWAKANCGAIKIRGSRKSVDRMRRSVNVAWARRPCYGKKLTGDCDMSVRELVGDVDSGLGLDEFHQGGAAGGFFGAEGLEGLGDGAGAGGFGHLLHHRGALATN